MNSESSLQISNLGSNPPTARFDIPKPTSRMSLKALKPTPGGRVSQAKMDTLKMMMLSQSPNTSQILSDKRWGRRNLIGSKSMNVSRGKIAQLSSGKKEEEGALAA